MKRINTLFKHARPATLLFIVPALFASVAGARFTSAASAAPVSQGPTGAQTWSVLVGGESTPQKKEPDQMPAGAWQIMRFYPETITVNDGDTIVWKINSAGNHQVVFPPPGQTFVPFAVVEPGDDGRPALVGNPVVFYPQGGPTYDGRAPAGSGSMTMAPPGCRSTG